MGGLIFHGLRHGLQQDFKLTMDKSGFIDILNRLSNLDRTWENLHAFPKSLIGIGIFMLVYYFLRHIVIRRAERLTSRTANDLDD